MKIHRNDAPVQGRPAPEKPAEKTKKKRGGGVYLLLMALCGAVFLFCAAMLIQRYWQDHRAQSDFDDLAAMIDTTGQTAEETPVKDNSAKFARLLAENPDFVGWISIDGTNLSFPVMQKPSEPNYYLRHDFSGQYSDYGVPYLEGNCILTPEKQDNNLVVYGHNMKTGTIFGCLTGYKKEEYYAAHPRIVFDTLYGDAAYEVFAAFAIDVVEDPNFVYNTYLDMDETTFNEYVGEVMGRSDVKSGITPQYGDSLLTLSTCEYSSANGRYVVCARRVESGQP